VPAQQVAAWSGRRHGQPGSPADANPGLGGSRLLPLPVLPAQQGSRREMHPDAEPAPLTRARAGKKRGDDGVCNLCLFLVNSLHLVKSGC